METFQLRAELGEANLTAQVPCGNIDAIVERWGDILRQQPDADHRDASKDFVIQALRTGEHHIDPATANGVVEALLWIVSTGDAAEQAMPLVREGGVVLGVEITNISGATYNFRTTVRQDEPVQIVLPTVH
ncbi:hypothetical protein J4G43_004990 [Bradyrhizobium barranii subsp. barranii]|uniref:Uncharacterized protein n=1 Tax=Bradyrhizobium barranii subsp. barranii TaxID=2823807 RepID=A0A939M3L2_9BRAD|nr:hypothetical protein [Bradyrhizobium barranii]UEM13679.1 hypothetical protein J4G43_004990 [Bradyrhizobium barranii subsp. barranii]